MFNSSGTKRCADCFQAGRRSALLQDLSSTGCTHGMGLRVFHSWLFVHELQDSGHRGYAFGLRRTGIRDTYSMMTHLDYVPTNTHAHTHLSNAPYARWRSGALTQKPSIATARDCRTACGGGGSPIVGTTTLKTIAHLIGDYMLGWTVCTGTVCRPCPSICHVSLGIKGLWQG